MLSALSFIFFNDHDASAAASFLERNFSGRAQGGSAHSADQAKPWRGRVRLHPLGRGKQERERERGLHYLLLLAGGRSSKDKRGRPSLSSIC